MSSYGYNQYEKIGRGISVSVDGRPQYKAGGITVAWAAVTAANADFEVRPEGETSGLSFYGTGAPADDYVYAGEKFIRWGTVMCKIIGGTYDGKYAPYGTSGGNLAGGTLSKANGDCFILPESIHEAALGSDHPAVIQGGLVFKHRLKVNFTDIQTLTVTATGGTFTLTYKGQTTGAQAYNVSAANLQTALEGLSTIGAGKVTVSLSSNVYTITLSDTLGVHEAFSVNTASLTGGSATLGTAADTAEGPTLAEFNVMFPTIRLVTD